MARRFLVAIPLLAGFAPLTGQALGLGEIELRSALNQPFFADIPLAIDAGDDLAGIDVRLASADTFARFGLDRPSFLSDLRFAIQPDSARPVIRVSSTRPVSEPFVSLLLEITWPKGRLLREYTVLLDPPAFGAAPPAPAVAAPAAPAPRIVDRAVPAPATPAERPAPASGDDGSSYGPVRDNETLWVIASQVRPDRSVTVNQVMLALFRANPEAFAGNINRLKAGAILRVPAASEIGAIGGADAEVRQQMAEWRSALPAATAAAGERLQLVPPGDAAPSAAAGQSPARVTQLEAELRESQRLLELKNRELQALQRRLGEPATAPAAADPAPAPPPPAAADAETALERLPGELPADAAGPVEPPAASAAPAGPDDRAKRPRPARAKPPADGGGLLDTIVATVLNVWFLGAAALVTLGALFLYRRRAAEEPAGRYGGDLRDGPLPVRTPAEAATRPDDTFIVEETGRNPAAGAGLRTVGGDGEVPLERTMSTEGAVELDQADVVAEADFHMAYGLYDQAADLLTRALRDDPSRRDLRLKLVEVYFIWENKGAFLKEAQAFRAQLPRTDDPDWNKVLIMGKQLCPEEALFAGEAVDAGLDINLGDPGDAPGGVDIAFDEEPGDGGLDLDLTAARQGPAAGDLLDFDLGDAGAEATQRTRADDASPAGRTMETPTIEARTVDSPTMETPTVESAAMEDVDFDIGSDSPTTETPTIEAEGAGTLETPTLESAAPGWASGSTGIRRLPDGADQTEEINLEDLGLDLTGLDEAAGDLASGAAPPGFDLGDTDGSGDSSVSLLGLDVEDGPDADSTAEVRGVTVEEFPGDDGTLDLPAITGAMDRRAANSPAGQATDDTAEQPRAGIDALSLESGELAGLDFDIGEEAPPDIEPTASLMGARGRGPEGPTMTEVGTKLDLARAYIDMGDPDGARSILNEVLDEGDPGQRQEARKLLDELAG